MCVFTCELGVILLMIYKCVFATLFLKVYFSKSVVYNYNRYSSSLN